MIDEKKKMTTHASSVGADDGQSISKNSDISITTSNGELGTPTQTQNFDPKFLLPIQCGTKIEEVGSQ